MKAEMCHTVVINKDNYEIFNMTLDSLKNNKEQLIKSMKDYPLCIEFAGYRFVLTKEYEYFLLIEKLQVKLDEFNNEKAVAN